MLTLEQQKQAASAAIAWPGETIHILLTINGQEQSSDPITLAQLIEQLGMKQDRVAVELNRNIIRREKWPETNLAEGDRLEIVHFVGGGLS